MCAVTILLACRAVVEILSPSYAYWSSFFKPYVWAYVSCRKVQACGQLSVTVFLFICAHYPSVKDNSELGWWKPISSTKPTSASEDDLFEEWTTYLLTYLLTQNVCWNIMHKFADNFRGLKSLKLWWMMIRTICVIASYDTIRCDSVYLTCSKKLTGSQLSPPHGTNKKLKCETKNKRMSMIGPVQFRCHKGSPVGKRNLRWEGFVEKVGFEPGVKEWRSDGWWEWWW